MTIVAKLTSAPIMGGVANATSGLNAGGTATSNDSDAQLGIVADAAGSEYSSGVNTDGRTTNTLATTAGNTIIVGSGSPTGPVASVVDNYVLTDADIAAGYHTTYVKIVPDVAGSYTVMVSTNASSNIYYSAGDKSATFTISTGSAPTGVTLTTLGGGTITGGSPTGNAILVSLVGGSLAGDEEITLTPSGTGKLSKGAYPYSVAPDTFAAAATAISLTASDFISGKKIVWLTSAGTAAETVSLTATGGAGIASTVTANKTYSVVAGAGSATVVLTLEAPSSTADYAMTNAIQATDTITVTEGSTSQKVGYTTPASMTAQKGYITVVDTAGTITGVANLSYDVATSFAATTAASGGAFSFAASGVGKAAGTTLFTVTIPAGTATVMGVLTTAVTKTFVTAARTNSAFTVTPSSTILAAPAAAIALTATLEDQFGAARANVVVTITTSGRNNPAAVTKTTDADGMVAFTTADASTSTTALTDTVTFSASGATSESVTINYANTAVGTVTVTGGNTTASVNALTNTDKAISVGSATTGAEAGKQGVTATVKDANGNALAGVAVTFSVAGTTAAITSTTKTVYTGADGTAVGQLYAWANGTYTYTVTAGGKSTTGTMTFASITAGNTRVVSATVSGNVVTGKAVDRFGNPVKGATLYASTTGGANIGGAFATSGSTLSDGTISWVVSGSGSVTVSAVNPADPAGTTAYQTCALAGNATCATASTAAKAYTAATAGTATDDEENVGSSFAPAGVASVTVGVENIDTGSTATDAAAEATDAANAATDAANAAAEAADAATAAAQDAADAVAALSAQVASLISGLKSQLTALTNLVIKIQKKVKA
jgi:hypothetical protein